MQPDARMLSLSSTGKAMSAKALTLVPSAHFIYWFFYSSDPLRIRALSSKGQEDRNKQSRLISRTFSQQSGDKEP